MDKCNASVDSLAGTGVNQFDAFSRQSAQLDLESELSRLAAEGVELIDARPRQGVHGRIAFIHPRAVGGVLIELVEHDRHEMAPDGLVRSYLRGSHASQ